MSPFIEEGTLIAEDMSPKDLEIIRTVERSKPTLSQQDCSAYYQAKEKQGTLITSDNSLRKFAESKTVDVHGHLWIFDIMIEQQVLTAISASSKLQELTEEINPRLRLPKLECDKRHKAWNK